MATVDGEAHSQRQRAPRYGMAVSRLRHAAYTLYLRGHAPSVPLPHEIPLRVQLLLQAPQQASERGRQTLQLGRRQLPPCAAVVARQGYEGLDLTDVQPRRDKRETGHCGRGLGVARTSASQWPRHDPSRNVHARRAHEAAGSPSAACRVRAHEQRWQSTATLAWALGLRSAGVVSWRRLGRSRTVTTAHRSLPVPPRPMLMRNTGITVTLCRRPPTSASCATADAVTVWASDGTSTHCDMWSGPCPVSTCAPVRLTHRSQCRYLATPMDFAAVARKGAHAGPRGCKPIRTHSSSTDASVSCGPTRTVTSRVSLPGGGGALLLPSAAKSRMTVTGTVRSTDADTRTRGALVPCCPAAMALATCVCTCSLTAAHSSDPAARCSHAAAVAVSTTASTSSATGDTGAATLSSTVRVLYTGHGGTPWPACG